MVVVIVTMAFMTMAAMAMVKFVFTRHNKGVSVRNVCFKCVSW